MLVLLLRYRHSLANTVEVWMETGGTSKHTNHHRYIPVHEIATKIGPSLCESLPAAHALSGCDTVSSFFGVGKKKVWRSLKKLGAEDIAALSRFHEQELDRSVAVARKFVVSLYDASNKYSKYHRDLNVMRYNISKSKPTALSHLPPCEATFIQHVRRAAWQTSTWTSAHLTIPQLPSKRYYYNKHL